MMADPVPALFTELDLYVLARAFVGRGWSDLPASPLVRLLLSQIDMRIPEDVDALRRVLGPDRLHAVFSLDPDALPPQSFSPNEDLDTVPALPETARLSADQQRQAADVGRWLDDYVTWAGSAANETPLLFHQGAGLWLAALAIGRRLYIHAPWGQRVFPNVYVMLVAVSTYYRKSAGLNLAVDLVRAAIPHMLLPQPGSPEAFMCMLGGVLPPNFDSLSQRDRERLNRGNTFAAQRGIARDELSALFKSFGRDFMAGMKELIMQIYDCPEHLDSNTNNRGLVVIQDAALSILGAATPAELAAALTSADWHNGTLARRGDCGRARRGRAAVPPREPRHPVWIPARGVRGRDLDGERRRSHRLRREAALRGDLPRRDGKVRPQQGAARPQRGRRWRGLGPGADQAPR